MTLKAVAYLGLIRFMYALNLKENSSNSSRFPLKDEGGVNWKGPDGENPAEGFPADDDPAAVDIVKEVLLYPEVEAYVCEGLCHQHKGNNQVKVNALHKLKVCDKLNREVKHSSEDEGDHCRAGGRITSSATMEL